MEKIIGKTEIQHKNKSMLSFVLLCSINLAFSINTFKKKFFHQSNQNDEWRFG